MSIQQYIDFVGLDVENDVFNMFTVWLTFNLDIPLTDRVVNWMIDGDSIPQTKRRHIYKWLQNNNYSPTIVLMYDGCDKKYHHYRCIKRDIFTNMVDHFCNNKNKVDYHDLVGMVMAYILHITKHDGPLLIK